MSGSRKQTERTRLRPEPRRTSHPLWLLGGFWGCVVISIAVVLRRLNALLRPATMSARPPQMAALDAAFSSRAVLTALHIVPAAIFVIAAAYILLRRSENAWLERAFFLSGAITGASAYAMGSYAIGGWVERSAVLVFNSWFLFSLARAYRFRLLGAYDEKRRSITRAVGVLLGIATTRPVMGVFFATSGITHLAPSQFFGIAFWIGFSINTAIVEWWLHSRARAGLRKAAA